MIVRLIALLLSLGMVFISADARDYAPVEVAAVVDVTDDAYDLVTPTILPAPERRTVRPAPGVSEPRYPGYESFVFRPPRAALG